MDMPSQRRLLGGAFFTVLLGAIGYFGQGHVHIGGTKTKSEAKSAVKSAKTLKEATTEPVAESQSEVEAQNTPATSPVEPQTEAVRQINLNTADEKDLQTVPGIGSALSQRIIEYRTNQGPFNSVDDLRRVKGIGTKLFDKLSPWLTL